MKGRLDMPSHKIHFKIAHEVNKILKLDEDSLMLGSVLPDLNIGKHRHSHYQEIDSYPNFLANPDKFISANKEILNHPTSLGYLLHILTDRYYNIFVYTKKFTWKNGQPISMILPDGTLESDRKTFRKIKQHDFWLYDKYLIESNQIEKFQNFDCINNIPTFKDIEFDIEFLKQYIILANKHVDNKKLPMIDDGLTLNYIYTTKEELDEVLKCCIKYILDYLKEKKLFSIPYSYSQTNN